MRAGNVAGVLLLGASQAWAECAWVLWSLNHVPVAGGVSADKVWTIVSAHHALPECEVGRTKIADGLRKFDKVFHEEMGLKPEPPSWRLICLPDTVDPRAPRGR